ncbi:DUF4935 domain-containing protein [Cardiobacteriaceae bacterium TAE3-ERU3]|nr:DUF4935 domain-containing protein [Cardiobacteriaceae bacterium TAE3-ERU3]
MKSMFPEHFSLSEEEIEKLWDNALFVFDTNTLLNLYRYSDKTKNVFLKILEKLKKRIWVSNHTANEFFTNRLTVISEQKKAYENAIQKIEEIKGIFEKDKSHPFVSKKNFDAFSSCVKNICNELRSNAEQQGKKINKDDTLTRIAELFSKNIGEPLNLETVEKIEEEGKNRFEKQIPPGYKDNKKNENNFGDLIIWNEIIEKSKNVEIPIIFITDDEKDDWWHIFDGKTLGPRKELIKEFKDKTGQLFHMYKSYTFIKHASNYLEEKIDEKTINEARSVGEILERRNNEIELTQRKRSLFSNKMRFRENENFNDPDLEKRYYFENKHRIRLLELEIRELKMKKDFLTQRFFHLEKEIDKLNETGNNREADEKYREVTTIKSRIFSIDNKIMDCNAEINRINNNSLFERNNQILF